MSVWQEKQVRESNLLHGSVVMFSLAVVLFVCLFASKNKFKLTINNFFVTVLLKKHAG